MKRFLGIFCLAIFLITCGCSFNAPTKPNVETGRLRAINTTAQECLLTWYRPNAEVSYYNVYSNDKLIGDTRTTEAKAYDHVEEFYEQSEEKDVPKIVWHNYRVGNLNSGEKYNFVIKAVNKDGKEDNNPLSVTVQMRDLQKDVNVKDYGAKGDGETIDTKSLQAAIDACPKGGRVYVPDGVYKSGALFLHGDMEFYLAPNCVLEATDNPEDFMVGKDGKVVRDKFFALLNTIASDTPLENIRILGAGTIDGAGWQDDAKGDYAKADNKFDAENKPAENNVLNIGMLAKNEVHFMVEQGEEFKRAYAARSSVIVLNNVDGVVLQDITVRNPAFHTIVLNKCNNVVANNIALVSYNANNGDGLIFNGGRGLIVVNSYFDTGDDSLNFSAGTEQVAKNTPTGVAWIFNNYFARGHGAVVLGSHTSSWIENILAEDNLIVGSNVGLRCKTSDGVGGGGRAVTFRYNVLKDIVNQAFLFTSDYVDNNAVGAYKDSGVPGQFRDMVVENCYIYKTGGPGIEVNGSKAQPYHNLVFRNLNFIKSKPQIVSNLEKGVFEKISFKD